MLEPFLFHPRVPEVLGEGESGLGVLGGQRDFQVVQGVLAQNRDQGLVGQLEAAGVAAKGGVLQPSPLVVLGRNHQGTDLKHGQKNA